MVSTGATVVIFVDYENIRISLKQNFDPRMSAPDLANALKEVATELGAWRGGKAYADWSERKDDARAFEDSGFNPRMVLRKRTGADRSDMVMSLDIMETLGLQPDADTYLVVSGDADFQDVVRRVRDAGKRVIVAGCAPTTAAGLISAADRFIALESQFRLTPKSADLAERMLPTRDWAPLIRLLADLEGTNRYLGINRLVTEWMAQDEALYGESVADRRKYLDGAKEDGVVVAYQAPIMMTNGKQRVVWCLRLGRQHPVVMATLALLHPDDGSEDDLKPESVPSDGV